MPNLTDHERRQIIDELLERSFNGILPRGALSEVAKKWKRGRSTVMDLWHTYRSARQNGDAEDASKSKIKQNSGRKRVNREEVCAKILAAPIEDRQDIRRAAHAAGVSKYMVTELFRQGLLKRRSGRIKPALTDENKLRRVEYALSFIDDVSLMFEPMFDVVHVDEKWFNADKDKRSYLLLDGEAPPQRLRQSKRFIPKTMFLAAVARPRHDPHRNAMWDGKLGIWAFTEEYIAQRCSRYREKGAVCVRNIETVNRAVYKEYLLKFLFPAIKEKWPRKDKHRLIIVQQDNAKPHLSPTDPDVVAAGTEGGWNIRLMFQPPNSPDMNVLDLGLFASLQSIQYQKKMRGIEDIVNAVGDAYDKMTSDTLNDIFLSLQNCMRSTLADKGGNQYVLPHMGKSKLRRAGLLPQSLSCDASVRSAAIDLLKDAGRGSDLFFSQ